MLRGSERCVEADLQDKGGRWGGIGGEKWEGGAWVCGGGRMCAPWLKDRSSFTGWGKFQCR